jgi:hypothetical protein
MVSQVKVIALQGIHNLLAVRKTILLIHGRGDHIGRTLRLTRRSSRTSHLLEDFRVENKLDSAEFDPSITQPFVLNPNGYRGECIGR